MMYDAQVALHCSELAHRTRVLDRLRIDRETGTSRVETRGQDYASSERLMRALNSSPTRA